MIARGQWRRIINIGSLTSEVRVPPWAVTAGKGGIKLLTARWLPNAAEHNNTGQCIGQVPE